MKLETPATLSTPADMDTKEITNRELLALARAWAESNYPGCRLESISIRCSYLERPVTLVAGPPVALAREGRADPAGYEHEDEELPLCVREILQTLREAQRPLSLTLLKEEMDRRGRGYSRSTLAHYCAELVQDGTLDNPPEARPRGYRLPEESGQAE